MGRSKIPVIISLFSLLVAAGSVAALFSVQTAVSKGRSHLKATSYLDDSAGSQTPLPIDPATIGYRQTAKITVDLKNVTALAVDPDGRIYVAGDKCLCRYAAAGRLETRIALPFEPKCLTIASRQHIAPGRIYVGFTDHVEVFDPDGIKVGIWAGVDKARFTSISTSDHDVFIADAGWNVIQHFDTTGNLLVPFGMNSPGHLAPSPNCPSDHFDLVVGLDDLVYVVNRRECRIEGWNFTGEVERHWGQASPAIEDFAGRNNPSQIALTADDRFVTAEEDPLRVKVCTRAGDFSAVVCGPEGTDSVTDLAADHHNRILVLDGKAHSVRIFEALPAK